VSSDMPRVAPRVQRYFSSKPDRRAPDRDVVGDRRGEVLPGDRVAERAGALAHAIDEFGETADRQPAMDDEHERRRRDVADRDQILHLVAGGPARSAAGQTVASATSALPKIVGRTWQCAGSTSLQDKLPFIHPKIATHGLTC